MKQTANGARVRIAIAAAIALAAVVAGTLATLATFAPQVFNISQGVASREGPACAEAPTAMGRVLPASGSERLPDVALIAEGERTVSLRNLLASGRGAVVNLWATWCAPCVREMPDLDRLHALLEPLGIKVIAISEDRTLPSVPRQFFEANDIRNLDVLIDPQGALARQTNVRGLPTTLLIGADGVERVRVEGIAEWPAAETVQFIRRCLASATDAAPGATAPRTG